MEIPKGGWKELKRAIQIELEADQGNQANLAISQVIWWEYLVPLRTLTLKRLPVNPTGLRNQSRTPADPLR